MKRMAQFLAVVLFVGAAISFIFSVSYNSNRVSVGINSLRSLSIKTSLLQTTTTLPPHPVLFVDNKLRSLARSYVDREFIHPKAVVKKGQKAVGPKMKNVREIAQVSDILIDINQPCGGNGGHNKSLLVLMYNQANHVDRRYLIRRTYGSALRKNSKTNIYFLVANDNDPQMKAQLEFESRLYNDIIMVNFYESYYNLTLKTISAFRWTAENCPKVKFMLKLDDDCFLRVNPLLNQIAHLKADTIVGRYRKNTFVNRQKEGEKKKWYIDPLYFPYKRYSQYLAGTFLVPGAMTSKIYQAIVSEPTTDTIPALPFEDTYFGLLAEKAKLPMGEFGGIYHMVNETESANLSKNNSKSIIWGEFDIPKLEKLWRLFGIN